MNIGNKKAFSLVEIMTAGAIFIVVILSAGVIVLNSLANANAQKVKMIAISLAQKNLEETNHKRYDNLLLWDDATAAPSFRPPATFAVTNPGNNPREEDVITTNVGDQAAFVTYRDPNPVSKEGVDFNVERIITWHDDPQTAGVNQDYKRIIIIVTWNGRPGRVQVERFASRSSQYFAHGMATAGGGQIINEDNMLNLGFSNSEIYDGVENRFAKSEAKNAFSRDFPGIPPAVNGGGGGDIAWIKTESNHLSSANTVTRDRMQFERPEVLNNNTIVAINRTLDIIAGRDEFGVESSSNFFDEEPIRILWGDAWYSLNGGTAADQWANWPPPPVYNILNRWTNPTTVARTESGGGFAYGQNLENVPIPDFWNKAKIFSFVGNGQIRTGTKAIVTNEADNSGMAIEVNKIGMRSWVTTLRPPITAVFNGNPLGATSILQQAPGSPNAAGLVIFDAIDARVEVYSDDTQSVFTGWGGNNIRGTVYAYRWVIRNLRVWDNRPAPVGQLYINIGDVSDEYDPISGNGVPNNFNRGANGDPGEVTGMPEPDDLPWPIEEIEIGKVTTSATGTAGSIRLELIHIKTAEGGFVLRQNGTPVPLPATTIDIGTAEASVSFSPKT